MLENTICVQGITWESVLLKAVVCHAVLCAVACRSSALSIEEVEAQMRASGAAAAAGAGGGLRLVPKSVRRELQDAAAAEAAERKLQEEVAVSVKLLGCGVGLLILVQEQGSRHHLCCLHLSPCSSLPCPHAPSQPFFTTPPQKHTTALPTHLHTLSLHTHTHTYLHPPTHTAPVGQGQGG